jgi:hypothetical protein
LFLREILLHFQKQKEKTLTYYSRSYELAKIDKSLFSTFNLPRHFFWVTSRSIASELMAHVGTGRTVRGKRRRPGLGSFHLRHGFSPPRTRGILATAAAGASHEAPSGRGGGIDRRRCQFDGGRHRSRRGLLSADCLTAARRRAQRGQQHVGSPPAGATSTCGLHPWGPPK